MKKRFLIGIALLLLLSTYNSSSNLNFNSKFNIEEIIIENNSIFKNEEIKKDLFFLYKTNIFSVKSKNISKQLNNDSFIESFEIKKIYPNKLRIKVFEKKPIAILQNKKKKFFYTNKGEIISFINLERFKDLPLVFGSKENFKILLNELKKINFPINQIKAFYFFDSNRWDLITNKNQTIKLPIHNYNKILKDFMNIYKKDNFNKFTIFDYRIKNQLILK
tara:strand:+ start:6866 stop:7525 length:660 start_codon:yes stop_codon:yes gene_type:complete